jgi:hypothetical protein
MLLPSGGGGGDAAAAAVVPRPCIWSGMMIRTGARCWLAGLAGLACGLKLLLGRQLDRRQAGRHATSHAGGEANVYVYFTV